MELEVYKLSGGKTAKKVKLSDTIYGIDPNDHAIWLDVRQYLNNQRQGTAKSKERNEITGSRRKIKRQKGTGTARAGDIKNPIFRGGGRVFGPEPRDYNMKLNKKLKRLARKTALPSWKTSSSKNHVPRNTLPCSGILSLKAKSPCWYWPILKTMYSCRAGTYREQR